VEAEAQQVHAADSDSATRFALHFTGSADVRRYTNQDKP
jgi:hypothetical protein